MAMPFTIEVRRTSSREEDELELDCAVEAIHGDLLWADSVFSMWQDESPVSRLARGEITLDDCPPAVAEVFEACDQYWKNTGGAFDARRPDGAVDPTGLVKTWAVARATWRLAHAGAIDWMIGASGDVIAEGTAPGGRPWRIGIADPRQTGDPARGKVVDVVALTGDRRALCTSGTAQHGEHIWNTDGTMEARYAQASVVGPDLVACDAWATAIVAGGEPTALAAQRAGFDVLCISPLTSDDPVETLDAFASPGWPSSPPE